MKHWTTKEYFFQFVVGVLGLIGAAMLFQGLFLDGDLASLGLVLIFTAVICELGLVFPAESDGRTPARLGRSNDNAA